MTGLGRARNGRGIVVGEPLKDVLYEIEDAILMNLPEEAEDKFSRLWEELIATIDRLYAYDRKWADFTMPPAPQGWDVFRGTLPTLAKIARCISRNLPAYERAAIRDAIEGSKGGPPPLHIIK